MEQPGRDYAGGRYAKNSLITLHLVWTYDLILGVGVSCLPVNDLELDSYMYLELPDLIRRCRYFCTPCMSASANSISI